MGNRTNKFAAAATIEKEDRLYSREELLARTDLDDAHELSASADADRAEEDACSFRWRSGS